MTWLKSFEVLKLSQGRRRDSGNAGWLWGILGDASGNPNVPGRSGWSWVRFPAGADEAGAQAYYPPVAIAEGIGASFLKKGGRRVWIGLDPNGQPEIVRGDRQDLAQVGITASVTNPLNTEGKAPNPANPFIPLTCEPVNTANTPGFLVTVYPLWYDTGSAIKYYASTEAAADKIDLESFVPAAADEYCYVVIWLDTDTNGLETPTASTPAVLDSTFGNADIITALEECYAARPNANCIPIKAFYLLGSMTTLTQSKKHIDLRQMVNMPSVSAAATPPFVDTTAIVKGSVDATKQLRFEVDGFTTATTRVLTAPNYDGTIATLAGTETLTSKTLTTPTIADFTNAQHNHTNAAGGGTLSAAAIASGQLALARGGTGADLSATGGANQFVKQSSAGANFTVGTIADADVPNILTLTQINDPNGNEQVKFTAAASAVNEWTLLNAATGGFVGLQATGSDTDIGIDIAAKGASPIRINNPTAIGGLPDTALAFDVISVTRASRPVPAVAISTRDAYAANVEGGSIYNTDTEHPETYIDSVSKYVKHLLETDVTPGIVNTYRLSLGNANSLADVSGASSIAPVPWFGSAIQCWQLFTSSTVREVFRPSSVSSASVSQSVSANTTNGSATITVPGGTLTLSVGMTVTGTGIPGSATISAIPTTTTFTLSANATATNTGVTLTIAIPANKTFDVFGGVDDTNVLRTYVRLWTNDTTRALSLSDDAGVPFLDVSALYPTSPYLLYLGTARTDGSSQLNDSVLKRTVWNVYNQQQRSLWVLDDTNTWAYTSGTIRQANGSAANQVEVVVGLAEVSLIELTVIGIASAAGATIGVGRDTTTAYSTGGGGKQLGMLLAVNAPTAAEFAELVPLGRHVYAWLEAGIAGNTFTGDAGVATRQSGMKGTIWA